MNESELVYDRDICYVYHLLSSVSLPVTTDNIMETTTRKQLIAIVHLPPDFTYFWYKPDDLLLHILPIRTNDSVSVVANRWRLNGGKTISIKGYCWKDFLPYQVEGWHRLRKYIISSEPMNEIKLVQEEASESQMSQEWIRIIVLYLSALVLLVLHVLLKPKQFESSSKISLYELTYALYNAFLIFSLVMTLSMTFSILSFEGLSLLLVLAGLASVSLLILVVGIFKFQTGTERIQWYPIGLLMTIVSTLALGIACFL
jgi:hypothetical protein